MNVLSIAAFLLAGGVLFFGINEVGNYKIFLDAHAILIVLGGSLAASSIAFQVDRLFALFKVFFHRVLRGKKADYRPVIAELMQLAEAYRTGNDLQARVEAVKDPFLKESMQTMMDEVLEEKQLLKVLRARVETAHSRMTSEVVKFKAVGKYPPAFGLMGTTLSMITLLGKLGQPGAQKLIGPSMALGLVATFYGLALSNLVFTPVSENLEDSAKEARLRNTIIVEGVKLIMQKTNPVVLAEELNAFLMPAERIDWKAMQKGGAGSAKKAA